ncbi:hypothetical protein L1285_09775 [Pseudoalteromonas sp. DL2-H2.2]|uniref:hypothetical protein n=1 Tax=Pseudoalteromonas sp. DL2-H2.2 TaxID=2908889 RepID=UPI001F477E13|nr:hypothetical protein [Pseudoalteromonas sp. DL2-H2.2]MCF2908604.1 hypothetical protein [Pseudoalteromonas sp. DL2-H2.2]
MRSWLSAVVISIACHLIILWLLAQQTVVVPLGPPEPTIKTYLVVEQPAQKSDTNKASSEPLPVTKPAQRPEQQTVVVSSAPLPKLVESSQLDAITESSVADIHSSTDPAPEKPAQAAGVQPNKKYQRIDPALGLSRLRQHILTQPVSRDIESRPQRLSVPKSHQTQGQPLRQIESQNHIFTEYRIKDRCYKEVQGDPNNPPPEGFAKNWLTASSTCDKTAITDAYDAAMGKWLKTKR